MTPYLFNALRDPTDDSWISLRVRDRIVIWNRDTFEVFSVPAPQREAPWLLRSLAGGLALIVLAAIVYGYLETLRP